MKMALAGYRGFLGTTFAGANSDFQYVELGRDLLYGDTSALSRRIRGADVVLNLAGVSIWRLWTGKNRQKIIRSREEVNRNLVAAVNALKGKKPVFMTASATHIYAEEESFLKEVVKHWEAPVSELDADVKRAILRMGVVLGKKGGALATMRKAGRLGFTAIMGSGKQYFSFIHIEDWTRAVRFIIDNRLEGVYNLSAPYPADNAKFTRTFAREAGVPFRIRIPEPLLKVTLGETRTVVTSSVYATPEMLSREGFRFRYPDIDSAMKNLFS